MNRWSEKRGSGYIELIVGESGDQMIWSRVLRVSELEMLSIEQD